MNILRSSLILSLSALLFTSAETQAQTGPAGVGTSASNVLWLDANYLGLSNNNPVSTWTDRSGNANNATQAGSLRPLFQTNRVNGKPTIKFDGTDDYMLLGTNLDQADATIFIVGDGSGLSGYRYLCSTKKWFINARHSGGRQWGFNQGTFISSGIQLFGGTWNVLTCIVRNGSTTVNMWTNGAFGASGTRGSFASIPKTVIGAYSADGSTFSGHYQGELAEVIVYNFELNSAQRTLVRNYLGSKYGRGVSNDVYAYESTHAYEMAGIGRDDASNIHSTAQGTGIIEISSPTDLGDGEYVVFCHNNTSLSTTQSSDVPSTVNSRLSRTWRVDMTGDAGTLTLKADLTGYEFATTDDNFYVLLVDGDGTFSNATVHYTGFSFDPGTDVVTFTGVDFADGDYFTIGYGKIYSVASTAWSNTATWNCNCIPSTNSSVNIGSGTTVTLGANVTTTNVTVETGAALDLSLSNYKLSLTGNFSNSGTLFTRSGEMEFIGTSAQTISGTHTMYTMTVNNSNGVTITSGSTTVTHTLNMTDGTLTTGGHLTIGSNSTRTARIATLGAGASISGDVTVQRYIPTTAAAGYRHLAFPLTDAVVAELDDNMTITGVNGATGTGSIYTGYWNNLYWYDEDYVDQGIDDGWTALTDVTDDLENTVGYAIWVYNADLPATLGVTGTVKTGNATFTLTYDDSGTPANDGWNLVGNPYPSQIDWEHADVVYNGSVNDAIYIWNDAHEHYEGWVGGFAVNDGTQYIASGQAFFVQTSAAAPTLSMTENVKTSADATFYSAVAAGSLPDHIKLMISKGAKSDQATLVFRKEATEGFDSKYDAWKLWSTTYGTPNIATVTENDEVLAINSLPEVPQSISVPVQVRVPSNGTYKLSLTALEVHNKYCVFIEDLVTGEVMDLRSFETYSFTAKTTDDEIRFMVHLNKNGKLSAQSEAVVCGGDASGKAIAISEEGPGLFQWFDANGNLVRSTSTPSLSDELTQVPAGTYFVSLSNGDAAPLQAKGNDNGKENVCERGLTQITVSQGTPLIASVDMDNSSPATCESNDGVATIEVSGGAQPYSIRWNDESVQEGATAIDLAPGEYQALITDANGCTTTKQVQVTRSMGPETGSVAIQNVSCPGMADGKISITSISGGTAPYSVTWPDRSSGLEKSGLKAGLYPVLITDANGCSIYHGFEVNESASVTASFTVSSNEVDIAEGGRISFDNQSTGTNQYLWNFGDGSISTEKNPVHDFNKAGTYTVTLSTTNGQCDQVASKTIEVINTLPGANTSDRNSATVTTRQNIININYNVSEKNGINVSVVNLLGQEVANTGKTGTSGTAHLSVDRPGIYLVNVFSNGQLIQSSKAIVHF
ncbi:MAG: T9SS type A sorting domain-containing protein [Flavobacteriales bacterium]|nr:T9SS type A sorting domain-containing protein [Flavobacteriales bacterium]